jgi:hypothetical protein
MKTSLKGMICVAVLGSVLASSAQTKFPLRVDVDVSTKRSKRNIGAGRDGEAKVENVQIKVKIRKSSGQPWTDPITAELYVIGKEIHTGNYVIIDVKKGSGVFDKEKDNAFEYTSPMYPIGRTSGNINVGGSYETYLVVITDHEGKIIQTRSGRSIKEEGIAFIRELGPLTKFDRDGNVLSVGDGQQDAFKNAIPSATNPGSDDY